MPEDPVLVGKNGRITRIQLNRPENRNSMNSDLMSAFFKAVEGVKSDQETRCLVITGSGNTFCSGADFKSGGEDDLFQLRFAKGVIFP